MTPGRKVLVKTLFDKIGFKESFVSDMVSNTRLYNKPRVPSLLLPYVSTLCSYHSLSSITQWWTCYQVLLSTSLNRLMSRRSGRVSTSFGGMYEKEPCWITSLLSS